MPENAAIPIVDTQKKWLKFLLERVGHNNLPRLLEYYVSIGWITELAANILLDLAKSEKRYKGESWTLSAQEQQISRLYIEKIRGMDVDDSLLVAPSPGKATPDIEKKIRISPPEHVHPEEKKKMEFNIHRRDVIINNLEKDLDERYSEIKKLNEKIQELENDILDLRNERMLDRMYLDLMNQNLRLKKAMRRDKTGKQKRSKIS